MDKDIELKFRFVNPTAGKVTLHIEPWGIQNVLASGESYEFLMVGPPDRVVEIEYGVDMITIWGWEGSTTDARTERILN